MSTTANLLRDTTTDADGNFKFIVLDLADTAKIVLRARKEHNGSNVAIYVKHKDYPVTDPLWNPGLNNNVINLLKGKDESDKTYTEHQEQTTKQYAGTDTAKTIKLHVVNIKSKINKKPDLTNSGNLNGPGNADQVIMSDQLQHCVNLTDCLVGRAFGVRFVNGKAYSLRGAKAGMRIIVDGVMQDPGASLNDLNTNDIYSIEVLRSGAYLAIYGSNASGGAIVVTTKRGGGENTSYITNTAPAGLITYSFKGYFKAKTFYSPKYNHPKTDNEPSDLRSTIYWNPNIITDKDGNASFEYFNNDTKGNYRVVVEGIDDNGNLGRQVYRYKVEK
jgi:hypothetical protein